MSKSTALDTKAAFDDLGAVNKMRFSEIDRLHRIERARDRKRIASGKATPEKVQKENSFVPLQAKIKFTNLRSYLRLAYA